LRAIEFLSQFEAGRAAFGGVMALAVSYRPIDARDQAKLLAVSPEESAARGIP
jgi:hypothetical protein